MMDDDSGGEGRSGRSMVCIVGERRSARSTIKFRLLVVLLSARGRFSCVFIDVWSGERSGRIVVQPAAVSVRIAVVQEWCVSWALACDVVISSSDGRSAGWGWRVLSIC
jgi:hypothetical protein